MPRHKRKIAARTPFLNPDTFVDEEPTAVSTFPVEQSERPPAYPRPAEIQPEYLAPVLLSEPEDSPCRRLLELLYKQWAPGKPLAFFCEEAGVSFEELVEKVERHYSGIARIHATKHFVEIFEDTAIDAKSRVGVCDRCDGGWALDEVDGLKVRSSRVCAYCEGTGYRRYPGDRQSRYIMFEAMGVVGKAKQPLVAIQQNINVAAEQASKVGFVQKLLEAGRSR